MLHTFGLRRLCCLVKGRIEVTLLAVNVRRGYRKVSSKTRRKAAASLSEFEEFYEREFGVLWPSIYNSMKMPNQHCAVVNKYSSRDEALEQLTSTKFKKVQTKDLFASETAIAGRNENLNSMECYIADTGARFSPPEVTRTGLMGYYLLDAASLLPVLALDVKPDNTVLDMCAAPGGKSVLIAQMLSSKGSMVANEPSYSRRSKLSKVVKDYIPSRSGLRETAHVWKLCGTAFGTSEPLTYDRVLVDAPCSAERHFLQNFYMQGWSETQSKRFSDLQTKLLISALNTVTHNGTVVYSTCSLSPFENDGVIEKTLQSPETGKVEVVKATCLQPRSEFFSTVETKYGVLVIPSETHNWGPLYLSKLKPTA